MSKRESDSRPWFLDEHWEVLPEAAEFVDVTAGNCRHRGLNEWGVPHQGNDCVICLREGFEDVAKKLAAVRAAGAVRRAEPAGTKALRR